MSTNQPEKFNNGYILSIAMVSALGGLLFGYDWVVIGGAKPFYEQYFNISSIPSLQGWAVSCALVGCIIGAALPGVISSWFGRKPLLIVSAVFFLISAIGTGGASTFTSFVLFRIFGGIGIGMASNLSPMYIAEISPPKSRGKYVSLNQLTIVIGILLAQVVNWCIAQPMPDQISGPDILQSWNGQRGWRWMFWAEIIPAGLFFILMWFVPESPRWLAARKENDRVKKILRKIGGESYAQTASKEIELSLQGLDKSNRIKDLAHPSIIGIVLIGIVLAVFQQWCGINVIFMYAEEIFNAAGYSVSDMLFNIVITGSVNLVFTLVAMSMVDRVGRKFLLLFGSAGLAIIYAVLGTFYFLGIQGWPMLILVVIAIACYAMTLAPVIWVVLSEIFPNRLRGIAMAVATFSLWIASLLLTFFFPIINNKIQASGSFWLFALICGIGYFYIKQKLIETKGKSLEEIEKELTK